MKLDKRILWRDNNQKKKPCHHEIRQENPVEEKQPE